MALRTLLINLCMCLPLALTTACATIRDDAIPPPKDFALEPAATGQLADVASRIAGELQAGHSGFALLEDNEEALKWRLALIDTAESSLDVLYYLWYNDDVGRLVLKRVLDAADRGVNVRLLVDDLVLIGRDKALVAIDRHPNISLRLFNPKRQRMAGMVASGIVRYSRLSIRMHNKLVVADNHAAILGGRNIANAYFGLDRKYNFIDIDVLGIGPVAVESSALFDNFWNSRWANPAANLSARLDDEKIPGMMERLVSNLDRSGVLSEFPLEPQNWRNELEAVVRTLHFGDSRMVYDRFEDGRLTRGMVDSLGEALNAARQEIDIVNAYIIPNQAFIDGVSSLGGNGVAVRILTNSLASHDVPAVNSHYKKWREPLIEAGAELFEQRAEPVERQAIDTAPVISKSVGLHSKAFVVDQKHVFIGSMNFDPRSANINSEMGVLVDSSGLANELKKVFEAGISPENAWHVTLSEDGDLSWTNAEETVTRQPALGFGQRLMDVFFMLFPVSQF